MPDSPSVLYHYCSTEAFVAIVQHASIRLSALTMSNDTEEGRLVLRLLDRVDSIDNASYGERLQVEHYWRKLVLQHEGLGFCLSENGDLLSQWRGYAAAGKGVCIGFSVLFLESICGLSEVASQVTLERVEYDEEAQLRALRSDWGLFIKAEDDSRAALMRSNETWWARRLYTFKNAGFAEEKEWLLTLAEN